MIKKVTVRKNKVTIDWDKSDYYLFFRAGLQEFADAQFGGKRKVVVLPASPNYELPGGRSRWFDYLSGAKRFDCPKELADYLVGLAVNRAIRDHIDRLERYKDIRSCGRDSLSLTTRRSVLRNMLTPKPVTLGPGVAKPESVCGVRRSKNTFICSKHRKAAARSKA